MVTVHQEAGFDVRIYSRGKDHPPPHVHVYKGAAVAIIEIQTLVVREIKGTMKSSDVTRAVRIVEANQKAFRAKWRELHAR